ncbi:MAG: cell division protein FtsZ [Alloprevotella sp.]|nr:cell division protein FtsZ [Bacteroidales bacterium]MDY3943199.1 cell division protein FtsZ [Alloprevotella sp.]
MSEEMNPSTGTMIEYVGQTATTPSIIKVIGVGGGGGNAVNHMYLEGFHEVNFVVCNTDSKALSQSPVPCRIQLGPDGLGAGSVPAKAREAAEYSMDAIRALFDDGTKMVFITAGMGGGTGTGAAPVIAHEAKSRGILTVGIVTIPFLFEGEPRIDQALDGVEAIAKEVDALLVINNERLREVYRDLSMPNAFKRADDTLSIAAHSIAEIVTMKGDINLDFEDARTVLKDGGVAIMSSGYGEGEGRMSKAIEEALNSPLLNSNDFYKSKKVLLCLAFNNTEETAVTMEEMNEVHAFMSKLGRNSQNKWGYTYDPELGAKVKVTILATGFGPEAAPGIAERMEADEEARTERREKYYGNTKQPGETRRRPKIYLFSPEDLGNEEVISLVEMTPTFNRTKEQLNEITNKNTKNKPMEVLTDFNAIIPNNKISF